MKLVDWRERREQNTQDMFHPSASADITFSREAASRLEAWNCASRRTSTRRFSLESLPDVQHYRKRMYAAPHYLAGRLRQARENPAGTRNTVKSTDVSRPPIKARAKGA